MPFRPDRLTEKTQEAIQQAQTLAQEAQHQEITPEHLLLALLQQPDGTVPPIVQQVGVDPARVASDVKAQPAARTFCSTCSGLVAPAMTLATAGRCASQLKASSRRV